MGSLFEKGGEGEFACELSPAKPVKVNVGTLGHHTKDIEKWHARSVMISRAVRTRLAKTSCVPEFLQPPR